jgi:iron complex outermembrane receptor protein
MKTIKLLPKVNHLSRYIGLAMGVLSANTAIGQSGERIIEEVLVTATKRSTSIETTPVAVSAYDQSMLDSNNVVSLVDMQGLVPNLHIAQNGTQNTPLVYIRGIGSADQTESGDPAVAFHVDGIYSARSQGATLIMYDLESAEVLRGPQGTLFGRNSTGGVINLHTAKPKNKFDASLEFLVGSDNRQASRAMVNIPIAEEWALRFAGAKDESDGVVDPAPGSTPGRKYGAVDLTSFRVSSLWQPSDVVQWFVSYESFQDRGTGHIPTLTGGSDRSALIQVPGYIDLKVDSLRSRLDYYFGNGLALSYLAGRTDSKRYSMWDRSWREDFFEWGGCIDCDHDSTQHEIQLKNDDASRLRWIAGAFWFKENNSVVFDIAHPEQDSAAARWQTYRQPDRGLESQSLYGQATYDFTDDWRLTLGARHTSDERWDKGGRNIECPPTVNNFNELALATQNLAANAALAGPDQCWVTRYNDTNPEWEKTTGLVRVEWDLHDELMAYLSYATGFKSGTIEDGGQYTGTTPMTEADLASIIAANNDEYAGTAAYVAPEENATVELGIKGQFFANKLQLFGALFQTKYEDLQVTSLVFLPDNLERLRKTNAGKATIRGLELEGKWLVGDNGTLDGSFTYLDATYDEFFTTDSSFGADGVAFNPSAGTEQTPNLLNFSGNTMVQAPEWTLALTYQHDFSLSNGGMLSPRVRMNYTDEIWFDPANRGDRPEGFLGLPYAEDLDRQDAYVKWDASIQFVPSDDRWLVELFVDNLTDEEIKTDQGRWNGREQPNFMWAPGRTWGVRLKAHL